ncbi:MAG TPA: DoxX family protein [Candidatus Acidoferrales bacterium]|nr:DoxX family protein [Candidatus Acidoferrales bacterium]
MKRCFEATMRTNAPSAVVLVRLLVGTVFLSEGVQKFLFPVAIGAGRFAKIGFPYPEWTATAVAFFEITCGLLVIAGLMTRLASIPLLIIISVAIATTKLPMLVHQGFWAMAHEARTDWCMFLGAIFLILVGAGGWSLDALLTKQDQ